MTVCYESTTGDTNIKKKKQNNSWLEEEAELYIYLKTCQWLAPEDEECP